jgi:alkaline phosphatase
MAMGNENIKLSFENFPYVASSKPYCADEQTADSACSATAYLSGVKGNSMTVGVTGAMNYMDCDDAINENKFTESIASWAQKAGKTTGFVTNTRVTHASPAGVYAHTPSRYWEDDSTVRADRCDPEYIDDIAKQLIHGEVGSKLKVVLGGGSRAFITNTEREHDTTGRRRDGRNLINEWKAVRSTRQFIRTRQELMDVNSTDVDQLFGLFSGSHMPYDWDIELTNRQEYIPTLTDMMKKAIEILSVEDNGFFLFVEGGRIDHAHHS